MKRTNELAAWLESRYAGYPTAHDPEYDYFNCVICGERCYYPGTGGKKICDNDECHKTHLVSWHKHDYMSKRIKAGLDPEYDEFECWCCGNTWKRHWVKGQRPRYCPDCRNKTSRQRYKIMTGETANSYSFKTPAVTLTCENCGRTGQWQPTPGNPPKLCRNCR